MDKSFLSLPPHERADILNAKSGPAGLPADVLEKDVWICWLLRELFEMPERLPMVFKGGTSLSKVYGAIRRMSEDLDITIDTRSQFVPFDANPSKNQLKKRREEIEFFVGEYIKKKIQPHLLERCIAEFGKDILSFSVAEEKNDTLRVNYPKAVESSEYLKETVDLEFGGRNLMEPNESHQICAYLESADLPLTFPKATINVLAAERTFWEKVTLLHAESNRENFRNQPGTFRHWYDISKLAGSAIAENALKNNDLLTSVVRTKKVLYAAKDANYDLCLVKQFNLIPNDAGFKILGDDFKKMVSAGMFFAGEDPTFETIMEDIKKLQDRLNN